jgi:hypothetical protein
MTRPGPLRLLLLLGWVSLPACLLAGTESAGFNVTVHMGQVCVSQALSEKTQAEVKVVCNGGEFVQIEASPDKPFVGTHGAAHRFYMPSNALPSGVLMANAGAYLGSGTVTSLRVYNIHGDDGPLEMLVTF